MALHFIEKTLETATGQRFSTYVLPPPLPSAVDINKQGQSQGQKIMVQDIKVEEEMKVNDADSVEEMLDDWKPQRQEWMVIITLATISLVVALDATILVTVLPTLAVDLHGSTNEAL
jgi:hypothetical protein